MKDNLSPAEKSMIHANRAIFCAGISVGLAVLALIMALV